MRPLRFGQIIWGTATTLLAGGIVACSGTVTPDPGGLGGSSGSTANGGSSGSSRGGSSGSSANGGTSNGGTSNGGSSNGGSSNGGSSNNNNGGTAGDEPDAGFEPDSGTEPEPDAGGGPEPDAGPTLVNLVANFDAEADTISPWIKGQDGAVAIATDQFHSGSQSIVTVGRDATWKGVGVDLFGLVEHGKVYDASVFMRVSAPSTALAKFNTRFTCTGSQPYLPIQQNVVVSSTSWTQLSGTFTVPTLGACPNMSSVLVFLEGVDALLQIYADDMVVTEQAP